MSTPTSPSGNTPLRMRQQTPEKIQLALGGSTLPVGLLPFQNPEMLKFSTGMQLKMAIMHLSHWAHDHDVKEDNSSGGAKLYPFIRAVADALMMRKELLADSSMRESTCGVLPLKALVCLLDRFVPDEFSEEPMDANVLMSLREAARFEHDDPPAAPEYEPPTVAEISRMSEREAAAQAKKSRQLGRRHNTSLTEHELQTGDDSDADLGEMARMFATRDSNAMRFDLVRDMWNHAVDRRRE